MRPHLLLALLMIVFAEPATAAQVDLRATFDQAAEKVRASRAGKPVENLAGGIAWGNSYELDAYLEMYLATGDRAYLNQFMPLADAVCAARADRKGELDFQGHLRRGWLTAGHYTWSEPAVLLDADGKPSLELVTSLYAYNNFLTIEVVPTADGQFDILVRDTRDGAMKGEFRGLTMDTVEQKVNPEPAERDVLHVRRLGDKPPRAQVPFTPPPAKTALHGHHTGKIISPLAQFAALVKTHPELADLKPQADAYLQCAEEVVPEMELSWTDLGDRGYYSFERDIPFWCDGVPEPHNVLAHTGSAFVWLHDATGNPLYKKRAEQLATFIKGNLEPLPDGTWMFYYWFGVVHDGWQPEDNISTNMPAWKGQKSPEDVSHGQLTVRLMRECADRGWVFNEDDLKRFARTFIERLYSDSPNGGTLWGTMRGAEGGRQGAYDSNIYGFMQLGPVDRQVYDRCRAMYEASQRNAGSASTLYGWAVLNRVEKELSRTAATRM